MISENLDTSQIVPILRWGFDPKSKDLTIGVHVQIPKGLVSKWKLAPDFDFLDKLTRTAAVGLFRGIFTAVQESAGSGLVMPASTESSLEPPQSSSQLSLDLEGETPAPQEEDKEEDHTSNGQSSTTDIET